MKKLSRTVGWVFSILLAFVFAAIGTSKLAGPSAVHWAQRFQRWGYPTGSHYVIGIVEIVAGIAILIPRWRRMAAATLMIIMVGALCTHALHNEWARVIPPIVLGGLAFASAHWSGQRKAARP
ncbi:MAG TPA: DoxX family protein [Terriglobales bacterium]|nr:DoxX family protein [Terriglobales bacterium]